MLEIFLVNAGLFIGLLFTRRVLGFFSPLNPVISTTPAPRSVGGVEFRHPSFDFYVYIWRRRGFRRGYYLRRRVKTWGFVRCFTPKRWQDYQSKLSNRRDSVAVFFARNSHIFGGK